jgi:hypothetical protein
LYVIFDTDDGKIMAVYGLALRPDAMEKMKQLRVLAVGTGTKMTCRALPGTVDWCVGGEVPKQFRRHELGELL